MTTTLTRLLKYPHAAVFDKDPSSVVAFHLAHDDGAAWKVSEGVLRATGGAADFFYTLADFTVGGLIEALQDDGFDVNYVSPDVAQLSALVLVEGEGDWALSNGDRLYAFTSLLWALLSSYAGEVRAVGNQVREALLQMVLTQAEGEWLDLWGYLYDVVRKDGEADSAYAPRIKDEAFRVRVNAHGIEKAILDETGWDVRIAEPWREIFTLDESLLSGPDKFYDGVNVGYHLIRPETRDFVDWEAVRAVIERNRAAGVMVLQSVAMRGFYVDGTGATVTSHTVHHNQAGVVNEDRVLLDFMSIEDTSIINHPARRLTTNMREPRQVVVDFSGFNVAFEHERTFRVYYIDVDYEGQYWQPHITWASADVDWTAGTLITSGHKRS